MDDATLDNILGFAPKRDLVDATLEPEERSLVIRGQLRAIVHITDPGRMAAALALVIKGYALVWGDEERDGTPTGLMMMRLTAAGHRLDI